LWQPPQEKVKSDGDINSRAFPTALDDAIITLFFAPIRAYVDFLSITLALTTDIDYRLPPLKGLVKR
jgi:hypothetical protein